MDAFSNAVPVFAMELHLQVVGEGGQQCELAESTVCTGRGERQVFGLRVVSANGVTGDASLVIKDAQQQLVPAVLGITLSSGLTFYSENPWIAAAFIIRFRCRVRCNKGVHGVLTASVSAQVERASPGNYYFYNFFNTYFNF